MFVGDERVAGRGPGRDGGEGEFGYGNGRQVLQAVHRDIDAVVDQGVLDGLGEDAEPAQRLQGAVLLAVPVGFDDHDLDRPRVEDRPQAVGDMVRLPQSELTAAGAEPEGGHNVSIQTTSGRRAAAARCDSSSTRLEVAATPAAVAAAAEVTAPAEVAAAPTEVATPGVTTAVEVAAGVVVLVEVAAVGHR